MLKHKIALVTGSTSGIGLAVARELAAQNATVLINGLIDLAEGIALANTIAEEFSIACHFFPCDLSQTESINHLMDTIFDEFGRIDILVNNAGIQYTSPIEEFPVEQWDKIISINLSSAFHTIRRTIPYMQENCWGRIINIASVHGLVASINKAAYVSAKHGIVGLTKVVALENANHGVTVNAICPGWVETQLIRRQIDDIAQRDGVDYETAKKELVSAKQPLHSMTLPHQIGAWVTFLCSEAASTTTGSSIAIDGGWTAQ
ncbi:MAG: hypothetical protein RIQ82_1230 [Bacteroidota bacterium]|jgi:3-hydroxybutyrate dehydrogenase